MRILCSMVALFLVVNVYAQNRTITGRVTDQGTLPVPNASVIAKGTTLGVTTDSAGSFSITVPASVTTLLISSLNFTQKEVNISGTTTVTVSLQPSTSNLAEVVVVAYGVQRKTNVTGSIATVKGSQLAGKPFTSIDKTLQGLAPGVQTTSASGAPGSATNVRIRGIGSINASAAPLWVIDGAIATIGDLTSNTTTANALSGLNPDDIESISILKDAAATSIYGSRAANGVIIVTTKKGKPGKTVLNVSAETGSNNIAYFNDKNKSLNSVQNQELLRESLINAGYAADNDEADYLIENALGIPKDYTKTNTDWYNVVTQTGNQSQFNVSLSGGNEKTQFYTSAGYLDQVGTVITSDFKRYNGSISLTHKPNTKFTLTTGINGSYSRQHTPTNSGNFSNPVIGSYFLVPWYSPYNDDGSLRYGDNDPDGQFPANGGPYNPVAVAELDNSVAKQIQLRGYLSGEYSIIPELKFTSRYSAEYLTIPEDSYLNPFYGDGYNYNGLAFATNRRVFDWTWTNLLDFRHALNQEKDFYFDVMGGYESQYYNNFFMQAGGQNFPGDLRLKYLASAAKPITATSVPNENSTVSYLSNLTVNYEDRFVLTGSFRRDGSSVFGSNNRWGNFFSVGGTWNLSEEKFLKDNSLISLLKIRASYGENGNALGFGDYQSLATYGFGFNYAGSPGSAPNNIGDSNLTWEKNKITNVGFDFALLNNRIYGSFDFYDRKTSNLLVNVPLSGTSGFTSQLLNVGSIQNRGYEITVGGKPFANRDFSWDVQFMLAHNKNKVLDLYNDAPIANGLFNITEGHDVQEFYLPLWAGVDPDNGDPLWYTDGSSKESTNDINKAPYTLTGKSASPTYFGSFTNTVTYKGISLSAMLYYNFGNYVYDIWDTYAMSDGAYLGFLNQFTNELNRWQKPGDITQVPKIIFGGNLSSNSPSTRYLYNGDYIRLRDIQLGYTLPSSLIQRWNIASVSVYLRGTNLFTWVKDDLLPLDPETGIQSTNDFDVFIPKTITAGIKVGF
ncbi:MAG TPA: TonB-dependent receptor [Parafilimonas sp.]|nr:TonB-dependent receptor [Parafilimonas sp.]